jgi:hypothetical protein
MASRTRILAATWQQQEREDDEKPLKLSKFDGRRNASAWVMKWEALIWFKKAQRSDFETWEEFMEALQAKFSEEWQHQ